MKNIKFHRNSQKRFYGPDKIYFITTVTHQRFPFFKEDLFCELFVENLRICKKLKEFKLYAFIIIPDHAHLLLKPGNDFNISKVMQFLKRHFSRDMNFILNTNNEDEIYFEGDIRECRLQNKFRLHGGNYENFSKIIYAHDAKLKQIKHKFITKYNNSQFEMPKFKWQKSFYDHVIRDEKDFLKHLNYIVFNCVRHKLCEDETKYKWSSFNSEFENFIDDWFK